MGLGGGGEGMVVVGFGSRVGDRMTATGSRPEDDGERESERALPGQTRLLLSDGDHQSFDSAGAHDLTVAQPWDGELWWTTRA